VPVLANPELLGQALDNLLENACKYSSPGSPIEVHVERGERSAKLFVQDRGMGISEEDIGRLFEPFYRSAQVRRQGIGGVGLGLAVVRRIASACNGSIEARSTPGQGSTFILELPAPSEA